MTGEWIRETWRVLKQAPFLWWPPILFALFTSLVVPGDTTTGLLLGWFLHTAVTAGWLTLMRQVLQGKPAVWGDFLEGIGRYFNILLMGQIVLALVWMVVGGMCLYGAYQIAGGPLDKALHLANLEALKTWLASFAPEQILVYALFGGVFFVFWGLFSWYTLLWQAYVVLGNVGWRQAFRHSYQTVVVFGWALLFMLVMQFSTLALLTQLTFSGGALFATFGFMGQVVWTTFFTLLYAVVVNRELFPSAPTEGQDLS